ncbi:unnamed protein product [Closterium sp. Naga37s-1]|nr:unnamed protein product [Closterium sp. Naga37s-1]
MAAGQNDRCSAGEPTCSHAETGEGTGRQAEGVPPPPLAPHATNTEPVTTAAPTAISVAVTAAAPASTLDPRSSSSSLALDGNEMSLSFESRVLDASGVSGRHQVSCTLVTGFLGCGKTTLLQHVLKEKGHLRVAVLVNEFSPVDVDSLLLQSQRANVAVGAPPGHGDLAGGCACCHVSDGLKKAVRAAVGGAMSACDYLILETSGLADPQPIAAQLMEAGVRLDRVVAVVEAETLPTLLEQQPIAQRQLAAADLVLLNKCDLVSLGALSDAEDMLLRFLTTGDALAHPHTNDAHGTTHNCTSSSHTHSHPPTSSSGQPASLPPPPVVRTRYCHVPLDLILDTVPVSQPAPPLTSASAYLSAGFLSHEATAAPSFRTPNARTSSTLTFSLHKEGKELSARHGARRCQLGAPAPGHASTPFTSLLFESQHPLPLAAFQHIVATRLRGRGASSNKSGSGTASSSTTTGCAPVKGLLRAKGFLFFKEMRHLRFVFQLSGSSRCSCTAIDTWDCPPSCRLVLIGQDAAELAGLVSELESLREDHKTDGGVEGSGDGVSEVACETGSKNVAGEAVCGEGTAAAEAARLVEMLTADERFEVRTSKAASDNREGELVTERRQKSCEASVVEFGMKGIPLKGIHQVRRPYASSGTVAFFLD